MNNQPTQTTVLKRARLKYLVKNQSERTANYLVKSDLKKKNIILGTFIATVIALTPILNNIYKSVPNERFWSTSLFTLESVYYDSAFVFVWTLSTKLVPLFLLLIWFFTCRHWWYHVLLVPISMFVYQTIVILNDDLQFIANDELLYLLPIMCIVIPSIYLLRAKMFNKINSVEQTEQEIEDEFKISSKSFKDLIKQYF